MLNVLRQRKGMHRQLRMVVRAHELSGFETNRPVAESSPFGAARHDSNMLGHLDSPQLSQTSALRAPKSCALRSSGKVAICLSTNLPKRLRPSSICTAVTMVKDKRRVLTFAPLA